MTADRNREAMLRFYEAINQHDVDAVGDCIAKDNVAHCLPEELGQTREDYLRFMQTAFVEGDRVAARFRNTVNPRGRVHGHPCLGAGFQGGG